jgi:hypothetical protein
LTEYHNNGFSRECLLYYARVDFYRRRQRSKGRLSKTWQRLQLGVKKVLLSGSSGRSPRRLLSSDRGLTLDECSFDPGASQQQTINHQPMLSPHPLLPKRGGEEQREKGGGGEERVVLARTACYVLLSHSLATLRYCTYPVWRGQMGDSCYELLPHYISFATRVVYHSRLQ